MSIVVEQITVSTQVSVLIRIENISSNLSESYYHFTQIQYQNFK